MDLFDGGAAHDFGAALGVADVHVEQEPHDEVENPAGELAPAGLHLVEHGSRHPSGTDHAIRLVGVPDEVQERGRGRRAVGVHVADQIGAGSETEALDERAAFADGGGKIEGADFGELGPDAPHDAEGIVAAAVEDDDQLEFALVIAAEVFGVTAQDRFDATLLVVSGYQQQYTWIRVRHGRDFYPITSAMSREICHGPYVLSDSSLRRPMPIRREPEASRPAMCRADMLGDARTLTCERGIDQ